MKRTIGHTTRVIPSHATAWAQHDEAGRDLAAMHALHLLPR